MDDPWGSPWATTDSDKDQKLASPAISGIAPPPRAFLSASSSPRIPTVVEQSPWAGDDDGSGDWAAAPETPSAQAVWGAGWGASSPNLTPTPRDDVLNKASPIAWPGNVATPKSANGSLLRQPSPDPWASGFPPRTAANDEIATPRLVIEAASPVDTPVNTFPDLALGIEEKPVWDKSSESDTTEETSTLEPNTVTRVSDVVAGTEGQVGQVGQPAAPVNNVQECESASPSCEHMSSTPSNDNTDHEDHRQQSPETSIDEEPKPRQPEPRKVSGKVQELVVKFDGLARTVSEERVAISRGRSRSPLSVGKGDGSDKVTEFGDFEDADENESPGSSQAPARQPDAAGAPGAPSPLLTDRSTNAPSPIAKFGPLYFAPDLNSITRLFTALPESAPLHIDIDHNLPDHIINDSFTQISERKTWYRISRLGSSRRHNAGDDESYRRIAWPSSTVYHDTIKVVRRWMEEDSIAGRVALGGGIAKTQKNMFGWDSSAEPVALDTVFGKKRPHARTSSRQSLKTHGLPSDETGGPAKQALQRPMHRPSGSAGPTVASFDWSSSSPSSAGQKHATDIIRQAPDAPSTASKVSVTTSYVPGIPAPVAVAKQTTGLSSRIPPAKVGNKLAIAEDVDGDEWGEMVSSPTVPEPRAAPSARQENRVFSGSATRESRSGVAAVGRSQPSGPAPDDPWNAADFSVFERDSGEQASHARLAEPCTTTMGPVEHLSQGPIPTPQPANRTILSTWANAPPRPSGSRTTDRHSTVAGSECPAPDPQNPHDEAANRIIAHLPDLSYMLW